MSSIKVMRRPHGCGLFTISLSSRTLRKREYTPNQTKLSLMKVKRYRVTHHSQTVQIYLCVGPEALPGDLLLDGLGVGLSKQVEHGAAVVMGVAVRVTELIGYRVEEQVTPCRKHANKE